MTHNLTVTSVLQKGREKRKESVSRGLPGWLSGEESACDAGATGDTGSIPESSRPPGGGHGDPPQYSCLENPMDRGACWATVHRVTKSRTRLK